MVTGNVRGRFVWLLFIGLYTISCKGAERNAANDKDTTILARSDQSFIINNEQPFYQVQLSSTGKGLSEKKIFLVLDGVSAPKNPDGVYEVYVTNRKIDVKSLSSSHPGFINVLDTYVLTAESSPDDLSIDLSQRGWSKDFKSFPAVTVTILFRGNRSQGGVESTQAGELTVKGIRVVQEK